MRLTRRSLLLSGAAATLTGRRALAGTDPSAPEFLIVLVANGGWDVTFSIDPKPRVEGGPIEGPWVDELGVQPDDVEEVRTFHGIPVQTNQHKRPSVSAFFQEHGDRCCVINGIWTGSIVHQPSRIRTMTGTTRPDRPDYATIVGVERGRARDLPLGTIDFSGLGYVGDLAASTGRIGHSSQLKALLDPDSVFAAPSWADYTLPLFRPTTDEEAAIEAHLRARVAAVRARVSDGGRNDALLDDLLESTDRRDRLLADAEVLTGPLQLGGKPSLDLQADLAVDLLKNGVCHTVTLAHFDSWDTHDVNALQHQRYEAFFGSLRRLAENLRVSGLLDRTLVVVTSEMTRTPRRNWKGGKDHWAHTSQIWFGAGVRGGTVVGGTSDTLESLPVDFATGEVTEHGELDKYDNLVAGLLCHMGVDSEAWLPGVRPFRGATQG